ncbi:cation:proton antiporter [Patescibacteria group bacterium]
MIKRNFMFEFLSFFIILLVSVFFSALFNRLHLPFVIALIIGGIIIGPFGFGVLQITDTIEFLGQIGLIFLMFIAGTEIKLSSFANDKKNITIISILNGFIPFAVGSAIAMAFGLPTLSALLLGIIFISSSVAVIIPSIEQSSLLKTRLGKEIISSTIIQDILSLVLLSLILQRANPLAHLPLPLFYTLLIIILVGLKVAIPKIEKLFNLIRTKKKELFDDELRLIFMLLIGVVVIFELLGLHPIIAGFFTGLVLSETIKSKALKQKIHAISYGLFIPIFFIVVGAQTDITLLFQVNTALYLTIAVILGSVLSKFISGYIAGRLVGFKNIESTLMGIATTPQLSTTLAVVFIGLEMGLLDNNLLTAMVALTIFTTFLGPLLINIISKKIPKTSLSK